MKVAALLAVLALGGCGVAAATPAATPGVRIAHFRFGPAGETVRSGQTVEWRNTDVTLHNVRGHGFFSRAIAPGRTWSHRFAHAGTYTYVCTLHPSQMHGTVVVR